MSHGLSDLALPILRPLEPVHVELVVHQGGAHLFGGVEHERAVLDDLLVEDLAGDQDEPRLLGGVRGDLDDDGVALLLEHAVVVLVDLGLGVAGPEEGRALELVGERVPALGQGLGERPSRLHLDVEEPHRRVRQVLDAVDAGRLARDHLDVDLVVDVDPGDLLGPQVAVPRLAHLQVRRQVHPELQPHVGAAVRVLPRHLRVHYPPPRRHELQVARLDRARVAGEVFVVDGAVQEVRDCGRAHPVSN